MQQTTALPTLPMRRLDAHKGDFGRVLVVGGSVGMSGAAVLCGRTALRGGAGLVCVAVPSTIQPIVAQADPCYTTLALQTDANGRIDISALPILHALCDTIDVIALGPGLGQSDGIRQLVANLSTTCKQPMVIDADGLNALTGQTEKLADAVGVRVITPHPGEFSRLVGVDTKTVQAKREELAVDFARRMKCIVVLKGHQTIVTDGERVYLNATGNPGMATGGSGDVLTGLLAALLGQKLEPFDAVQLAVYLHGLAGDHARDQIGEASLIATDLIDFLPAAMRSREAGVRESSQ